MVLYLHIGTEKTGSSYLQSLAAQNRKELEKFGIHFPSAGKRDHQMLKGEISAGNAQSLTNALEQENWPAAKQLLNGWKEEARAKNCQVVLLSNELLMLALSLPGRLEHLSALVADIGIQEIHALLVLRNPVDQALSLYKHRAKAGTAPSIEDWPEDHYHYGLGLQRFLQAVKVSALSLTARKYRKKGLEQVFFTDWLGVPLNYSTRQKSVNPSLSLSELLLIRQLRERDTLLPRFLYERLLALPKATKDPEPKLSRYYKEVLTCYLSQFEETWQLCNQFLPKAEKLEIPKGDGVVIQQVEKVLTFSPAQSEIIAQFIKDSASPPLQWKLQYRKFRHRLGRLKNKLIARS